ncbi:nitroreductase family protein [Paenibacillus sp. FA6]|uniref:nitroreductase family protein n=1 Tax=Paenibacillus sp. FA6 TaxID=3413029 RepID=UPI003F65B305
MNISEAIRTRRSIGKVTEEDVPVSAIEQILEAGTWAPNHRLTEPWRFFVLRGEGRKLLGHALADIAVKATVDPTSPEAQAAAESARKKPMRAPVIITVAVTPKEQANIIELEEYGAVFSAIQNMLLEAHALGLGAIWRTGEPTYQSQMNEHFGLSPKDKVLGFIYLGIPVGDRIQQSKRTPFQDVTVWVDQPGSLSKDN